VGESEPSPGPALAIISYRVLAHDLFAIVEQADKLNNEPAHETASDEPGQDAVFTSLYSDKRAQALNEFFKYGAEIYVLAGALRDAIAAHYEGEGDGTPRDSILLSQT